MGIITEDYPEHIKLEAIQYKSQAIGEFIEFGGYVLAEYVHFDEDDSESGERLVPVGKSITNILAGYFEIDQIKIEEEKQAMLNEIRKANE